MISPFIINDKNLFLDRFPVVQVNRSLQAWDASDEYLVNYIEQQQLINSDTKLLIMNDDFGAISVNFLQQQVITVSDSFISEQGLKHNIEQNNLSAERLSPLSSLAELPDDIDVILYKIPKNKNLLAEQLIEIKNSISSKAIFIAADKAKNIQTSTLKLFEKYLGTTKTSLAVKKSRLVFCQLDSKQAFSNPQIKSWPLENTPFSITNRANVFAREKLDIGARLFIKHLPELTNDKSVIDLGCGNGVIGLSLLKQSPLTRISFIDESYMAVQSAQDNVHNNIIDAEKNCQFIVNDCLTDVEAAGTDVILCNPPFHQQNATTDHIAWQMFKDSYRALKKGGELRIVGNRQLGYHIKLKRIFGNEILIASNDKFVILSAIKR